jgi:hypothetical protein
MQSYKKKISYFIQSNQFNIYIDLYYYLID